MKKSKHKNRGLFLISVLAFTLLTGMSEKPPLVGGPVPHFQLQTLNGSSVKISDYRGKVVLLNFWASWCTPCKAEMPEIQAAYEAFKDQDFVVLGVNFGEKPKEAKKLVKEMNLTFPILLDKKVEVAERHNVVSLPVTFFIDPSGIIKERLFGGTLTKRDIEAAIQRLQVKKG
ncbi:MAG: TlpA family protein disulfide reductase [Nitrospiria bacterium]